MPRSALIALLLSVGCSPTHLIIGVAADTLGGEGPGWGTDDDPELIAQATPFALKTMETLIASDGEQPNPKLFTAACGGFTEFAYAFVWQPAEEASHLRPGELSFASARAAKLLARANAYCWRGLNARHPGGDHSFAETFKAAQAKALQMTDRADVPLLYWTAASLALQISLQKDHPELLAELPTVGVLAYRAEGLNESWNHGSIHELLEAYEASRPAAMGGSSQKALQERDLALAESESQKLGPWLTWAEDVAVASQDRALFDRLLGQVQAFNVDSAIPFRLANVLAQRRAAWLKSREDELFL